MFRRPKLIYALVVAVMVVGFAVSSLGQGRNSAGQKVNTAHSGNTLLYWIAASGWILFGVALLALIGFTIALAVRGLLRRGRSPITAS